MRGPPPKDSNLLRGHRRNRAATQATLPSEAEAATWEVPPLPPRKGKWHEQVVAWWDLIWRSPMAAEYIDADKPGLDMLAVLHQAFWTASNKDKFRYAAEIRQQESRFGLTPVDRRRLQWAIKRGEAATKKTAARRRRKKEKDPREVLGLVK